MYCNRRTPLVAGRHAARACGPGSRNGFGRSAGPEAGRGAGIIALRPADNQDLEAVTGQNAIAIVVLDPLMSAISDTPGTHVNRQVRQALDPLARTDGRAGSVVPGITHSGKPTGTDASS